MSIPDQYPKSSLVTMKSMIVATTMKTVLMRHAAVRPPTESAIAASTG